MCEGSGRLFGARIDGFQRESLDDLDCREMFCQLSVYGTFAFSGESIPSLAKIPAPKIAIPIVILRIFRAVLKLRDESGISFDSNSHLRNSKSVGTKGPETPKWDPPHPLPPGADGCLHLF